MAEEHQNGGLSLSDMISALRRELEESQEDAADEKLRFGVSGIEVETQVQVSLDAGAKGGVRFWIIEAGGEVSRGKSTAQRVKLNLTVPGEFSVSAEGRAD